MLRPLPQTVNPPPSLSPQSFYSNRAIGQFADVSNCRQRFGRGGLRQRHRRRRPGIGAGHQLDHGGGGARGPDTCAVAVRVLAEDHHRAGHWRVHGAHHHRQHSSAGIVHCGPDHPAAEQLLHRVAGRHGHVDRYEISERSDILYKQIA